jgi:hypothetical protein
MTTRVRWVGVGLAVGLASAVASAAPRLEVAEPVHDFGTVEQGAHVDHSFRVRNAGDQALRLDHVKSTCGCTIGSVPGQEVAPGGAAFVTVSLDTARLAGRTTKTVTLYTNDPDVPVQPLALTGTVETDLVLSPTPLYVGHLRPGERVQRDVLVRPGRPGGSAQVSLVETDGPEVRAHVEPGADPGTQRVVVELPADLPPGRFDGSVTLRTTSATQPVINVPVFGTVDSDVAVLPPQVTFGISRAGSAPPLDVHIRNRGRRPMAVTKVVAPPSVAYELNTVRPGVEWTLTLRLRDPLPADGKVDTAVEIFTDHPSASHLVVPVYAIDRGRG